MTVFLFIAILLVLVVGHEFGHLIVAKLSGMKVPEFGIGFPPKLWGKKIGETEYTINALPFGGFVKIVGEDISDETRTDPSAFSNRPKYLQGLTLLAGPGANILIALILSSLAFMVGIPAATDGGYSGSQISNARVLVLEVVAGSPSDKAGIRPGDQIVSLRVDGEDHVIASPDDIPGLIEGATGPVDLSLMRRGASVSATVSPEKGIVIAEPDRQAIGISTASVGILKLSFFEAIGAGFSETVQSFKNVFLGIFALLGGAFTLSANLSQVAGPVGIAHLVGDAVTFGLGSVLSFAALISMNLGVINLLPFPALDGGRLAFVVAEAIFRRPIPAKIANSINLAGFAFLILLMVAITAHDIFRLAV